MALRLEELIIINITKNQLISILYELFALENESKYIVDAVIVEMERLVEIINKLELKSIFQPNYFQK